MIDDERPYILPFNYGYKDNCIYIHSASEGKKIDLLRKNNRVCFELEYKGEIIKHDDPCKWATRYQSVVGYGTIEILTEFEQKRNGLDIIMAHNGAEKMSTYNIKQVESIVILKLTITEITGKQSSNWSDN